MRKILALALLLIQLRPFVGAGVCLHAAAQHQQECDMPADRAPSSEESKGAIPPECAQMTLCAPAAPSIPQDALQLVTTAPPFHAEYSGPSLLLPGDPIVPPEPPPIA